MANAAVKVAIKKSFIGVSLFSVVTGQSNYHMVYFAGKGNWFH
jgi:hypothetical protein